MKVGSIRPDLPYISNSKAPEQKSSTAKTTDKLELSEDAMSINSGILSKIKSGFYDSKEVRDTVIEKILQNL